MLLLTLLFWLNFGLGNDRFRGSGDLPKVARGMLIVLARTTDFAGLNLSLNSGNFGGLLGYLLRALGLLLNLLIAVG